MAMVVALATAPLAGTRGGEMPFDWESLYATPSMVTLEFGGSDGHWNDRYASADLTLPGESRLRFDGARLDSEAPITLFGASFASDPYAPLWLELGADWRSQRAGLEIDAYHLRIGGGDERLSASLLAERRRLALHFDPEVVASRPWLDSPVVSSGEALGASLGWYGRQGWSITLDYRHDRYEIALERLALAPRLSALLFTPGGLEGAWNLTRRRRSATFGWLWPRADASITWEEAVGAVDGLTSRYLTLRATIEADFGWSATLSLTSPLSEEGDYASAGLGYRW